MEITVHAVIVPPLKPGLAYAHTDDGRCMRFTGDRAEMIALCNEVKAFNTGGRGPVRVRAAKCRDLTGVAPDECCSMGAAGR